MLGEYVASTHAKAGGECDECGMAIGVFNRIYKYTVVGGTVKGVGGGNGPGVWVCQWCHDRAKRGIQADAQVSEVDLWECSKCLRMSNPVVIVGEDLLCFPCYGLASVDSGRLL